MGCYLRQTHWINSGIHGFHIHANGSCEPDMKDGKPVPALKQVVI